MIRVIHTARQLGLEGYVNADTLQGYDASSLKNLHEHLLVLDRFQRSWPHKAQSTVAWVDTPAKINMLMQSDTQDVSYLFSLPHLPDFIAASRFDLLDVAKFSTQERMNFASENVNALFNADIMQRKQVKLLNDTQLSALNRKSIFSLLINHKISLDLVLMLSQTPEGSVRLLSISRLKLISEQDYNANYIMGLSDTKIDSVVANTDFAASCAVVIEELTVYKTALEQRLADLNAPGFFKESSAQYRTEKLQNAFARLEQSSRENDAAADVKEAILQNGIWDFKVLDAGEMGDSKKVSETICRTNTLVAGIEQCASALQHASENPTSSVVA